MNWLTNYIKPKLESLVKKKDVPRNLWIKCACEKQTMIYYKDFEKSLGVCSECGTHMRLPSDTRIKFLLDDFTLIINKCRDHFYAKLCDLFCKRYLDVKVFH